MSKHLSSHPQGGGDNTLIALFKLLSPDHLLKLPFTNHSNSLDNRFSNELLHIIGLTETKEGSKKLIERNKAGERQTGTILEDAIFTPGFITMYICRETNRKAVVQKFNKAEEKSPLERGFRGVSETPPNSPLPSGDGGASQPHQSTRRAIIPYNPKLKELARKLRNNSTKSEIILWKELKGKFEGKYDFHRQKPLDNYIADFFCYELKLVIEIDGETHNWEDVQQRDFQKETRFNELGLNVLRFSDSDVFLHVEATLEIIRQYVNGFERGSLSELQFEDSPLNPLTGGAGIL